MKHSLSIWWHQSIKQTQRNTDTHKNSKCRAQPRVIMTELRACDLQRLVLLLIMADGWAQNTSKSGASASISMCLTSAAAPPPQTWEDSCVTDEQNHTNENATRTTVVNIYFQAICFWVLPLSSSRCEKPVWSHDLKLYSSHKLTWTPSLQNISRLHPWINHQNYSRKTSQIIKRSHFLLV